MSINISEIKIENKGQWDSYVKSHPMGNIYQLSGWKAVIENTYGHKTYYLLATHGNKNESTTINQLSKPASKSGAYDDAGEHFLDSTGSNDLSARSQYRNSNGILGILPIVHIKNILFGNNLISMPFCDMGGVLADNDTIKRELVLEALKIGKKLSTNNIELRNIETLKCLISINGNCNAEGDNLLAKKWAVQTPPCKVRMVLELPESSDELMKSFKSKLRSQIKKPIKEGLDTRIGQTELLDDFYHVFAVNMKDLGSPVHSKRLFHNILKEFSENCKIAMTYIGKRPVAGGVMLFFKNTLMNPWASFLKSYKLLSPNMFLYWSMLAYASDNGFKYFDFGRCTPGGGTYKFKEQWGANPEILDYSYFSINGSFDGRPISEKKIFKIGSEVWKKLPVFSTKIGGPLFRKYIGL